MYSVIYSDDARHSIAKYKKSNPASFRSCFEFISEAIERMFPGVLFHHLMSIASSSEDK